MARARRAQQRVASGRRRSRRRLGVGLASLAALSIAAACGSDDGGNPFENTDPTSAEFEALPAVLAMAPDTPENRGFILVANTANFESHYVVRWPSTDEALAAYGAASADPVVGLAPVETLRNALGAVGNERPGLDEEFGVDPADITVWATYGQPPDDGQLMLGELDPDAAADALGQVPFWSDLQEEATHGGHTYYRWGDDHEIVRGEDDFEPTAMRPLGQGMRLFIDDDVAHLSKADAVVESFLDARDGEEPSLADDEAFLGIAERLGFDGFINAFVTDQLDPSAGQLPTGSGPVDEIEDSHLLTGVLAYGAANGPGESPDEAQVRIVMATDTEENAETNADRFREHIAEDISLRSMTPWADTFEVVDTEVDGRFLIVELTTPRGRVVLDSFLARDGLVASD